MKTLLVFVALLSVSGCGTDSTEPGPPASPYLPQTSPENVLENLQRSFRLRDAQGYSRLLHPEFIFVYQQSDVQEVGTEFWTRDQDTTTARCMFLSARITRIAIDFTYERAVPVSAGSDTLYIRVNPAILEVDELEADETTTTWRVQGIEDMYFVRGEAGNQERWYLIEWRDIPRGLSAVTSPAVEGVTWGKIKYLCLE